MKKLIRMLILEHSVTRALIKLMKISIPILIWLLCIPAFSFSQMKYNFHFENKTVEETLNEISELTQVDFFYSTDFIDSEKEINKSFINASMEEVIRGILGKEYAFDMIEDDLISIKKLAPEEIPQEYVMVEGYIYDEQGNELPGAVVKVKDLVLGTSTDINAFFKLRVPANSTLEISFNGFVTQELVVGEEDMELNIKLKESVNQLNPVVVTGIVNRQKESFTGAVSVNSGDDLREVGNLNVVESVKSLDPSFIVLENTDMGSNPNRLPNIEVRGKTSINTSDLRDEFASDPNQPLFVLDGFETTLRVITDLDMNRVASITILKDAASTALYGSRAANGVVVVETKRPEPGELQINYTMDYRLEVPDLSDYNMMNSTEKLEFERLSGNYTHPFYASNQYELDLQYNRRLAEIARGVDTYWLDLATQNGHTVGNSIYIGGGDQVMTYGIGANYRTIKGVMEGSQRNTSNVNFDLGYRKGKWNISNRFFYQSANAAESPYGSFRNFVQANPYFRPFNIEGEIEPFLNVLGEDEVDFVNPLFAGTLNNLDNTESYNIRNNFQARYSISSKFRFDLGIQLLKGDNTSEVFYSPEDPQFVNTERDEKGSYTNTRTQTDGYRANAMLTYANVFKEKHRLNLAVRGDVEESNTSRIGFTAVGFPLGTNPSPTFAFSFDPDTAPLSFSQVFRRLNVLANMSYVYNRAIFVDATYRLDGSTAFGSNERYSPFWSTGLGWNLAESFEMDPELISLLKLRGSYGITGNQGFGQFYSVSIYEYMQVQNIFGQGYNMRTLGNPDLQWQRTTSSSVGLDWAMFNSRFSGTINLYKNYSDPLVVEVDLPASTGVSGYPYNTGNLTTKGLEWNFKYALIDNKSKRLNWTLGLTSAHIDMEYNDFANSLNSLNDKNEEQGQDYLGGVNSNSDSNRLGSNALRRYKDGYSPTDIWAVRSLGIDPATGKEVYLTRDGQPTFQYNVDDVVRVGNTTPKAEGVVQSFFRLKNFNFNFLMRYRYGGDAFNTTLYQRIENINKSQSYFNQDRRALYDRWQQPGDISRFKSIGNTNYTPITDRFVQEENVLIGESISFGYQFVDSNWIKDLGMSNLRVNMFLNDIFRWSSIKNERGIDYPFSRVVSFSLNATF